MPVYSRNETIRAISAYYESLVEMYLPEELLLYPPDGGWPEITKERFACLKKTDAVIDLLRHLPYIRRDEEGELHEIYEQMTCVDYRGGYMDRCMKFGRSYGEPISDDTTIPSHVASIAVSPESDSSSIFIDTERGTATWYIVPDGAKRTELSQVRTPRLSYLLDIVVDQAV